ncbi:type II toxin-antitoxin system RelE/ParE family toxin [Flavobacterium soyangense]|uniref:Type II toxin-antitoxin system RelE/ParE family toxin n=1 Tax=Flavobacterium soyangense TaxID=2023265 RepID=A0A930U8K2_9FLAO|nr:type II toxin-antitoxin system RelE/ParE family toxin [Flavobacterium soyangense]
MRLKLNWTVFAKGELHKIFQYYKSKSNLKTAKNIVEEISKQLLILEKYPFIGQKEELLMGRKQEFHYFLCSNYKIIYCVNLEINLVEIVDIFDCHQEPLKIKRTK